VPPDGRNRPINLRASGFEQCSELFLVLRTVLTGQSLLSDEGKDSRNQRERERKRMGIRRGSKT
jgi:hypothetical protein